MTTIKSNILRACPFCGEEAVFCIENRHMFIKCVNCFARTDGFDLPESEAPAHIAESTMKTVGEWNRREAPNYIVKPE